jgi:hypothetical protein
MQMDEHPNFFIHHFAHIAITAGALALIGLWWLWLKHNR